MDWMCQETKEIQITPEMIEAGAIELVCFDWMECDAEDAVRRVFTAMVVASQKPEASE